MAGDEPMRRVAVAVLAPALGQHEFFLRFQHREPPDLFQVPGETAFRCKNWKLCRPRHACSPISSQLNTWPRKTEFTESKMPCLLTLNSAENTWCGQRIRDLGRAPIVGESRREGRSAALTRQRS